MNEPVYTATAERVYGRLAGFRRGADRALGTYPLKRYLSVMLDQLGRVMDTFDRIDYLTPDEPGSDSRPLTVYANLLTNPSYEDAAPLPVGTTNATAGVAATSSWTDEGDAAWRFVAVANGTFGGVVSPARLVAGPGPLIVSGDVWAFAGRTVRWQAQPVTAAGAAIGAPVTADVVYAGPGFEREEVSLLMPAGTAGVDVSVFALGGVAAEQLVIDCLLAQQTGVRGLAYRRYAGVLTGDTSDLANPDTADDKWLDWLGQIVGVRLSPALAHPARVDAVKYAPAGWQAATKAAVANAAKTALTGGQYAAVYDHSTDAVNGLGTASMWDVLIVTRSAETADTAAVLAAVVAKRAKPAGVTLHIRAYNATWAQVVGQYPTWAAIRAAGSWSKIEEAGLV